jgi:hypothetical protein
VVHLSLAGELVLGQPLIGFLLPVIFLARFRLLEGFMSSRPLVLGELMRDRLQADLLSLVPLHFDSVRFRFLG